MNRLQHFRKYLSVTTVAAVGLAIAGLAHAANPQIHDVEVDGASVEVRATGLGNIVRGGDDLSIEVIATGDVFTMCRNPSGRLVEAQSEFRQNFDFDVDERDITRNGSFTGNFNLVPSAQDVCPNGKVDSDLVRRHARHGRSESAGEWRPCGLGVLRRRGRRVHLTRMR